MDRICVRGIAARGFHGALEAERVLGQHFSVDLTVHLDLSPAGRSDDLTQTLNYDELATMVVEQITGPPFQLIEALAESIADQVLELPGVQVVEVTVHKPHAPVIAQVAGVSVHISRGRSSAPGGDAVSSPQKLDQPTTVPSGTDHERSPQP